MRPHGQIYITGGTENAHLHKTKHFNCKRFLVRGMYLSKPEAEGHADALRGQEYLARVVPRMVWINRAGWVLGRERVQGYVLYVHYGENNKKAECKHVSGKSMSHHVDCESECEGESAYERNEARKIKDWDREYIQW